MQEIVIVLGQSLHEDGTVPTSLKFRVKVAREVVQHKGAGCIVIATGSDVAKVGITEAEVMHGLLEMHGVVKEEQSRTTLENAYYCGSIIDEMGIPAKNVSITVITSDFHLPRSLLGFRKVLENRGWAINGIPAPSGCPVVPSKTGINSLTYEQRLKYEINTVKNRLPKQYSHHVKRGEVKVPVPSAREIDQAVRSLYALLDGCQVVERKFEGDAPNRKSLQGKNIVLVRHAESRYQTDKKDKEQKWCDTGLRDALLTEKGVQQAKHLSTLIDPSYFDLVCTSPLRRAVETCGHVLQSHGPQPEVNIVNIFGEIINAWSDIPLDTPEEIPFPHRLSRSKWCQNAVPWALTDSTSPVESEADVRSRVAAVLSWLGDRKEKNILVFTHSKLMSRLVGGPKMISKNCHGVLLTF
eukprot:TRINITY_DN85_c5_g1_i1.p1 TRINITY_DN85_c5_g1~~TRINITY_DN85_c5_g1_i1.p1  ORF type:complete len:411 (+),score=76.51 TRINITY_DN85_c5_g1_i1:70-1302(+)